MGDRRTLLFPSPRQHGEKGNGGGTVLSPRPAPAGGVPEGRVRGGRACTEVPLIRRLRGTFSPSARGEGKWGRHRSFPLAPRQRGRLRRAGEGVVELAKRPLIRRCGAPSPREGRVEGKWRRHRSFPSPRASGERVPEGWVRGGRACKEVPLIRPPATFSPSTRGEGKRRVRRSPKKGPGPKQMAIQAPAVAARSCRDTQWLRARVVWTCRRRS